MAGKGPFAGYPRYTPRSFSQSDFSSLTSSFASFTWYSKSGCPWPDLSTTHFFGWKWSCHYFVQTWRLLRSCWICWQSCSVLTVWNSCASSANSFIGQIVSPGMSLMNMMNKIGPSTLPWGIPLSTFAQTVYYYFLLAVSQKGFGPFEDNST